MTLKAFVWRENPEVVFDIWSGSLIFKGDGWKMGWLCDHNWIMSKKFRLLISLLSNIELNVLWGRLVTISWVNVRHLHNMEVTQILLCHPGLSFLGWLINKFKKCLKELLSVCHLLCLKTVLLGYKLSLSSFNRWITLQVRGNKMYSEVNCPFIQQLLFQLLPLVDDVGRDARDGQLSYTCIYGVQAWGFAAWVWPLWADSRCLHPTWLLYTSAKRICIHSISFPNDF